SVASLGTTSLSRTGLAGTSRTTGSYSLGVGVFQVVWWQWDAGRAGGEGTRVGRRGPGTPDAARCPRRVRNGLDLRFRRPPLELADPAQERTDGDHAAIAVGRGEGVLVVSVAVVVPPFAQRAGVVEHGAEDRYVGVPELVHRDGEAVALGLPGADDEEQAVGDASDDGGVGHHVERRRVDDDGVVLIVEALDEGAHSRRGEELGGIGRYGAGAQEVERRVVPGL